MISSCTQLGRTGRSSALDAGRFFSAVDFEPPRLPAGSKFIQGWILFGVYAISPVNWAISGGLRITKALLRNRGQLGAHHYVRRPSPSRQPKTTDETLMSYTLGSDRSTCPNRASRD